jgi:protein-S-isoprenylcysteine O-methyltransferase Ste14
MTSLRNIIPLGSLCGGIILALALHSVSPIVKIIEAPVTYLGIPIILLGIALMGSGIRTIQGHKTDILPGGSPTVLVVSGPYRYTRNPIYLGMITILTGVCILLGTLSPFIVVPIFFTIVRIAVIPYEERKLTTTFGEAYREYQKRVRRWF